MSSKILLPGDLVGTENNLLQHLITGSLRPLESLGFETSQIVGSPAKWVISFAATSERFCLQVFRIWEFLLIDMKGTKIIHLDKEIGVVVCVKAQYERAAQQCGWPRQSYPSIQS
ncbi:hypothetical protein J6590_073017 [Homalodisca vitripennis]|nr:hypothetical protein J6590_073017 [Homalodisca vitripennis]